MLCARSHTDTHARPQLFDTSARLHTPRVSGRTWAQMNTLIHRHSDTAAHSQRHKCATTYTHTHTHTHTHTAFSSLQLIVTISEPLPSLWGLPGLRANE